MNEFRLWAWHKFAESSYRFSTIGFNNAFDSQISFQGIKKTKNYAFHEQIQSGAIEGDFYESPANYTFEQASLDSFQ